MPRERGEGRFSGGVTHTSWPLLCEERLQHAQGEWDLGMEALRRGRGVGGRVCSPFAVPPSIFPFFPDCSNSTIFIEKLRRFVDVDYSVLVEAVVRVNGVCVLLLNGQWRTVQFFANIKKCMFCQRIYLCFSMMK